MTMAYAYTLLLEATVLAASFGILWLSFWILDCRRPYREMQSGECRDQPEPRAEEQEDAKLGPLVIDGVAAGARPDDQPRFARCPASEREGQGHPVPL